MSKALKWIIALVLGGAFGWMMSAMLDKPAKYTPCPVINDRDIILKHERYEMFIDSMEKAKKKDVERLTDSLLKYRLK